MTRKLNNDSLNNDVARATHYKKITDKVDEYEKLLNFFQKRDDNDNKIVMPTWGAAAVCSNPQ